MMGCFSGSWGSGRRFSLEVISVPSLEVLFGVEYLLGDWFILDLWGYCLSGDDIG